MLAEDNERRRSRVSRTREISSSEKQTEFSIEKNETGSSMSKEKKSYLMHYDTEIQGGVDLFLSLQTSDCMAMAVINVSALSSCRSRRRRCRHWFCFRFVDTSETDTFLFLISLSFWPSRFSQPMFDVVIAKWLTMKKRKKNGRERERTKQTSFSTRTQRRYTTKKKFSKQHQQLRSVFSSPRQKMCENDNGLHTREDK